MADLNIKTGDRLPIVSFTIDRASGAALGFDTADVSTVVLIVRKRGDVAATVNAAVTSWAINGAGTQMTGTYEWAAGDTDEAGKYLVEIQVTLTDGRRATFPNDEHARLTIRDGV